MLERISAAVMSSSFALISYIVFCGNLLQFVGVTSEYNREDFFIISCKNT